MIVHTQTIVDQRPQDLVLLAAAAPLNLPLSVVCQAERQLGLWRAVFQIVGESHRIQLWHDGTFQFEEVLACVPASDVQPLLRHSLHDGQAYAADQGAYRTSVSFSPSPRAAWPEFSADAGIEYAFPRTNGLLPITRVQWEQTETQLSWWTLHTYAQASGVTYVYSKSDYLLNREDDNND